MSQSCKAITSQSRFASRAASAPPTHPPRGAAPQPTGPALPVVAGRESSILKCGQNALDARAVHPKHRHWRIKILKEASRANVLLLRCAAERHNDPFQV